MATALRLKYKALKGCSHHRPTIIKIISAGDWEWRWPPWPLHDYLTTPVLCHSRVLIGLQLRKGTVFVIPEIRASCVSVHQLNFFPYLLCLTNFVCLRATGLHICKWLAVKTSYSRPTNLRRLLSIYRDLWWWIFVHFKHKLSYKITRYTFRNIFVKDCRLSWG